MERLKKRAVFDKCSFYLDGVFCIVSFLITGYALHDMQTAQGVGLYLSELWMPGKRELFDVLVDAFALFSLLLLTGIPCVLLKRRNAGAFIRFLSVCLAMLPVVSLAAVVHFFDPPGMFAIRQAIIKREWMQAFREGMENLRIHLQLGIPFLCILLAARTQMDGEKRGRWLILSVIAAALVPGVFLFPVLAAALAFIIMYLILIVCFDIWEQLYDAYPGVRLWGMILFGGVWLRGIYRLIVLMEVYHL